MDDENAARNAALRECSASISTCNGIAVYEGTDVSIISCRGGGRIVSYVGGSEHGNQTEMALKKARSAGFRDDQCYEFASYN